MAALESECRTHANTVIGAQRLVTAPPLFLNKRPYEKNIYAKIISRKAVQGRARYSAKIISNFPRKVFCARPRKVCCISYHRL